MNAYEVKKFTPRGIAEITVPASKSITSRVLLLAALSKGDVRLHCGTLCGDTRAFIACLETLGIRVESVQGGLLVHGCGGQIPRKSAKLCVENAGTAARFLPAALAFCGGEYEFTASRQMSARPMGILPLVEAIGAEITFSGTDSFPFRLRSDGVKAREITVNTDESTQYASAILLAAGFGKEPFTLRLVGSRTRGSYIDMTLAAMRAFGILSERRENEITVFPQTAAPKEYFVEPDLSGACYFFALALLCRAKILVRGAKKDSMQGDGQFIKLLQARGLNLTQTDEGLLADGSGISGFDGFDEAFTDFSDQTLTAAALAPFAATPTHITGVEHIRRQECDRIAAIEENLKRLGVPVSVEKDGIIIMPAPVKSTTIKTFGDHRVAMAFSLVGLKAGGITIDHPDCCKKTFENYFEILSGLTE